MCKQDVYIKESNYESIIVICPFCNEEIIYNRITDLGMTESIARKEVDCLNEKCRKTFAIISDSVNSKSSMLIFESKRFIERKKYSMAILILCQAYEVFFNTFLEVKLVYEPCKNNPLYKSKFKEIYQVYYKVFKKHPFFKMRNVVINFIINEVNMTEVDDINEVIKEISKSTQKPEENDFEKISNMKTREILLKLYKSKINKKRNKIIHKHAYRSSMKSAEGYLREINEIIPYLRSEFNILDDDPNMYL